MKRIKFLSLFIASLLLFVFFNPFFNNLRAEERTLAQVNYQVDFWYKETLDFYQQGRYAEAKNKLNKIIKTLASNPPAVIWRSSHKMEPPQETFYKMLKQTEEQIEWKKIEQKQLEQEELERKRKELARQKEGKQKQLAEEKAKREQERKAKEEALAKQKEERLRQKAELKAKQEQERKAKEAELAKQKEQKQKQLAEEKAKQEQERKVREEELAQQRLKQQAELERERQQAQQKRQQESALKQQQLKARQEEQARHESERKTREAELKAQKEQEAQEKQLKQEAERKARQEALAKQKEERLKQEAELKAKQEQARKAREEEKARVEVARKAKEVEKVRAGIERKAKEEELAKQREERLKQEAELEVKRQQELKAKQREQAYLEAERRAREILLKDQKQKETQEKRLKLETERKAKEEELARQREERLRQQQELKAKQEQERKTKEEERLRAEAERKARETELKVQKEQEAREKQLKQEAERKARQEELAKQREQKQKQLAEEKARQEQERKAKEAELKAQKKKETQEKQLKLEAAPKARKEELARQKEEKQKQLAEEKARREQELKAKQEALAKQKEERLRQEAELKAKQEQERKAREAELAKQKEERLRQQQELEAKQEQERKAKEEEKARVETERKAREAEPKAQKEAQEKQPKLEAGRKAKEEELAKQKEEKQKQLAEEKARREQELKAKQEALAKQKEERLRQEAELKAKQEQERKVREEELAQQRLKQQIESEAKRQEELKAKQEELAREREKLEIKVNEMKRASVQEKAMTEAMLKKHRHDQAKIKKIEKLWISARRLYEQGMYEQAIKEFDELIKLEGNPRIKYTPSALEYIEKAKNNLIQKKEIALYKGVEQIEKEMVNEVLKQQVPPYTEPPQRIEQREPTPLIEPPAIRNKLKATKITIDFDKVGLKSVISFLSQESGINFVASQKVLELALVVSARFKETSLDEAIKYITKNLGLLYRIDKEIVWVAHPEEIANEPMETRVYYLNRGGGLFTEFSPISTGTTETGLGGSSAQINKIFTIEDTLKEIIPWPADAKLTYDKRINALIVRNTPQNLQMLEDTLYSMDVEPLQVLIEARFLEVNITDTKELGVDWNLTGGDWQLKDRDGTFKKGIGKGSGVDFSAFTRAAEGLNLTYKGMLTNSQFQAVLHALEETKKIKTLSSPRITTLNNQMATIKVVDEWIYPTRYEYEIVQFDLNGDGDYSDAGETTFKNVPKDFLRRDVGILLKVIPAVGSDKKTISLSLIPEVSEGTADGFTYTGGVTLPKFTSRNLSTTVIVNSGETVVLGGLIKESRTKTLTKVPFLGNIPLVGALFKKNTDSIERKNLLIFVTAKVLSASGEEVIVAQK